MALQLSYHVQYFVAIALVEYETDQKHFFIEFQFDGKIVSEIVPQILLLHSREPNFRIVQARQSVRPPPDRKANIVPSLKILCEELYNEYDRNIESAGNFAEKRQSAVKSNLSVVWAWRQSDPHHCTGSDLCHKVSLDAGPIIQIYMHFYPNGVRKTRQYCVNFDQWWISSHRIKAIGWWYSTVWFMKLLIATNVSGILISLCTTLGQG